VRIGQLAERCCVSADTIRYYEKISLLPRAERTPSGYRQYREPAIGRVRLVRNALRFGFSLKEIGAFLRVRQSGGTPCQNVRAAGGRILEAMDRQMGELTATREWMKAALKEWDERLALTPAGRPAHLLEALQADDSPATGRRHAVRRQRE
jgi:DNA-binding transcriptional MerR regulator